MTPGQLVKAARQVAGMTQLELAKEVGVTQALLSSIESDLRESLRENAGLRRMIAERLGIDPISLQRETARKFGSVALSLDELEGFQTAA